MKISLNWLKKYVKIPGTISDEDLIRLIGARLVEIEGVIDETHKYDNIYVIEIKQCEKIPDTHLTLCQIDAGRDELVQVVCGAPNVHVGMLAVWIAPGAIVPASVREDAPFVIGERKMRGFESCGMLAGADELDFGDDHSGIVEIDPSIAKSGDLLADVFELNDLVLEIENKSLTHRPDCFGIIGFAREVAGIMQRQFECDFSRDGSLAPVVAGRAPSISAKPAISPRKTHFELSPNIKIDAGVCQRYTAVILEKHGELKQKFLTWQDTVICKSGMRPVDPIVDATNYLMLLTGQPLHAFDYDKFVKVGKTQEPEIVVRLARKGEKLVLLDEKEVELNTDDIVICAGDIPVALAGAMGGKSTEIDENTRRVLIESATFSLYNLRKTQMAHGIFSEAITRFTKGQPAYQTLAVAEKCAEMLSSGFKLVGISDECPNSEKKIVVKITTNELNELLGTEYDDNLILNTLENVGFVITRRQDFWEVLVPEWRTDIHIKEDIIEEVGRLLGYDNIRLTLPLHRTAQKDVMFEMKKTIRELMWRLGANEVLTYSFVSGKLLQKANQGLDNSYMIVNSISPDLQYVRQRLVPSLLDKTYMNEKLPVDKFAIYEMNKVYQKKFGVDTEGVPVEKMKMGFVIAERKNAGTAFYKAKKYVDAVFAEFGVKVEYTSFENDFLEYEFFEPKRSAIIRLAEDETVVFGIVGEFKKSVKHGFKLADYLAGFEIDLDVLEKYCNTTKTIELGKIITEDFTLTTDKTYEDALAEVREKYPDAKIMPGAIYQAENQKTRNITFHIVNIAN